MCGKPSCREAARAAAAANAAAKASSNSTPSTASVSSIVTPKASATRVGRPPSPRVVTGGRKRR